MAARWSRVRCASETERKDVDVAVGDAVVAGAPPQLCPLCFGAGDKLKSHINGRAMHLFFAAVHRERGGARSREFGVDGVAARKLLCYPCSSTSLRR
jgi:hypothetical protein